MSDFEVHPVGTRERIEQLDRELRRLRTLLAELAGIGDAPSARDPFADW